MKKVQWWASVVVTLKFVGFKVSQGSTVSAVCTVRNVYSQLVSIKACLFKYA